MKHPINSGVISFTIVLITLGLSGCGTSVEGVSSGSDETDALSQQEQTMARDRCDKVGRQPALWPVCP